MKTIPAWTSLGVHHLVINLFKHTENGQYLYQVELVMFIDDGTPETSKHNDEYGCCIMTEILDPCLGCAAEQALAASSLLFPNSLSSVVFVIGEDGEIIKEYDANTEAFPHLDGEDEPAVILPPNTTLH